MTTDVERAVTDALRSHAQRAMDRTDTEAAAADFLGAAPTRRRRRRRGRLALGTVAVAASLAVAVVLAPGRGGQAPPPVDQDDEALQIATAFMEAFSALDPTRAESYLSREAHVQFADPPGQEDRGYLSGRLQFDAALGTRIDPGDCFVLYVQPDYTQVGCGYALDLLGSRERGVGPFEDNVVSMSIAGDRVIEAFVNVQPSARAFFGDFLDWLSTEHAAEEAVLDHLSDPDATPAETERSLRIWHRLAEQYAERAAAGDTPQNPSPAPPEGRDPR